MRRELAELAEAFGAHVVLLSGITRNAEPFDVLLEAHAACRCIVDGGVCFAIEAPT